jgi:hypothetical protein
MKTIAVRLEGLLVENSAAIPNADPIPAAAQFVQTLYRGGSGRVFIVTSAPEEVSSETIRIWLRQYQIPMTDIIRLVGALDWREEDQILSAAGARSTVLGLYVVASYYDTEYMAAHGVPTVAFVHADPVIDFRPERGLTWSSYGLRPEEDS